METKGNLAFLQLARVLRTYFKPCACNFVLQVNAECQAHWANEGQKHNRKEYDLSHPDLLKQETPARVGDNDPRLGLASMQTFRGEDLGAGERKKMQCAQQSSWCVYSNVLVNG